MMIKIIMDCATCGKEQPPLACSHIQLKRWVNGVHLQDAMPQLSADERELLISATCGSCFDRMFGDEG